MHTITYYVVHNAALFDLISLRMLLPHKHVGKRGHPCRCFHRVAVAKYQLLSPVELDPRYLAVHEALEHALQGHELCPGGVGIGVSGP